MFIPHLAGRCLAMVRCERLCSYVLQQSASLNSKGMELTEKVLPGNDVASVASQYLEGINRLIREYEQWWSVAAYSDRS